MMHVEVVITRFVCAILMHLVIEPEVLQGLTMFKYVLNHTKERGSLNQMCRDIFDHKFCFIKDPNKKPSQYLYLEWNSLKKLGLYIPDDKMVDAFDADGKKVPVKMSDVKTKAFNIPKVGTDVKEQDLATAFILLKRAQFLLGIRCLH